MMKALLLSLSLAGSSASASTSESFEFCTPEGPCGLQVNDAATGEIVWLVTEEGTPLMDIWGENFWRVSEGDYAKVRAMIPSETILLPGVNPTTKEGMR